MQLVSKRLSGKYEYRPFKCMLLHGYICLEQLYERREKLPMNAVILTGYGKNICFFADVGSVQLCLI